jgi:type IV secretory pathway VirB2 component (pilin)
MSYAPRKLTSRIMIAGFLSLFPQAAFAQVAVANPQGSGPIVSAMEWMQGTLLGNVATTAAVIAVAVVGLMMLTGRMNWRFGATVIVGCFVLFGATAIVSGIRVTAMGG